MKYHNVLVIKMLKSCRDEGEERDDKAKGERERRSNLKEEGGGEAAASVLAETEGKGTNIGRIMITHVPTHSGTHSSEICLARARCWVVHL